MLIQAQYQKEREKKCNVTASTSELRNTENDEANKLDSDDSKEEKLADEEEKNDKPNSDEDVEMTDTKPTEEKMDTDADSVKEEKAETKTDETENNESSDSKDKTVDESGAEAITIEENADKNDPYTYGINIDPRTYCKLGHFHLLLEDYAKGISFVYTFLSVEFLFDYFLFDSSYSNVSLSKILQFGKTILERYNILVWIGSCLLPLQCISMVSKELFHFNTQIELISKYFEISYSFHDE